MHQIRRSRDVDIVFEQHLAIDGLIELNEPALGAEHQAERKRRFGRVELVGAQEAVGQGHLAQIENAGQGGTLTDAASCLLHAVARFSGMGVV